MAVFSIKYLCYRNILGFKLQRCIFSSFYSRSKSKWLEHWLNLRRADTFINSTFHSSAFSHCRWCIHWELCRNSFCTVQKNHCTNHTDTFRTTFFYIFVRHSHCFSMCFLSRKDVFTDFKWDVKNSSFDVLFQSVVNSWYELLKDTDGFFFSCFWFSSGSS